MIPKTAVSVDTYQFKLSKSIFFRKLQQSFSWKKKSQFKFIKIIRPRKKLPSAWSLCHSVTLSHTCLWVPAEQSPWYCQPVPHLGLERSLSQTKAASASCPLTWSPPLAKLEERSSLEPSLWRPKSLVQMVAIAQQTWGSPSSLNK